MIDVLPAAGQRADPRIAVRADRRRLHGGLRHRPAHQLRPRRDLHDRRLRGPRHLSCALPGRHLALWVLPLMIIGAIIASVAVAVLMERFAYRPLRNAPRLAPLITAIGVSVFLQEAVRLFYPGAKSKLPFPQIDVVTGPALQIGGADHPAAGDLHRRRPRHLRRRSSGTSSTAPGRPRHAGRLPGPRHRPADGHQHRPDHRRRLRPRRRPRRRRRRRPGPAEPATSTSGWASSPASRRSPPPSSAASATSTAPSSAAWSSASSRPSPRSSSPAQFGGSAWKDVWAFVPPHPRPGLPAQGLLGARVVDRA